MDLDRLQAELTKHEPTEHRGYLMVPRQGQMYSAGSGVPMLGVPPLSQSRGLFRVGEVSGPAPIDFIGVYLTLDEYVPFADSDDLEPLIQYFIGQVSEAELLTALAILNRAAHDDDMRSHLMGEFTNMLNPLFRERLESLVDPKLGEGRREFLARQPVLVSMREVLTRTPARDPSGDIPPLLTATFLVHTVAMGLNAERHETDDRLGGYSAHLAMEIIRNESFHAGEDTYALLDRHVRLWREFGVRADDPTPRMPPGEHLVEATGVDLITLLSAGFGLWANISAWKPGTAFPVSKPIAPGLTQQLDAILQTISRTPAQFRRALRESPRSPWDLLVFQETPVMDLGHGLVVLDEDFLLDKVTTGLYWEVHDHEKGRSEDDRRLWTQVYGQMVEFQMEESIDALVPPDLGGTPTSYSEEDLGEAYPGKRTDRVVDRGDTFLLAEVVSGRLTVASRIEGDVGAFRDDTEKLVMKKVRQLNETGRALAADGGTALTGIERGAMPRMLPVVVVAGGFGGYPINPVTVEYVRKLIKEEGVLSHPCFDSLCVLDTGELELLEGLAEDGRNPVELLREWQDSSLWRMPFKNWVFQAIGSRGPSLRPQRMEDHMDSVFEEIKACLDLHSSQ